ncbi:MAG: hypothetical protein KBA95_18020 [Acidobacteria bacterium]|nr:hypothetical protein [Acidobacteriota bacterium]
MRIDGVTLSDYSTAPVKSATITKSEVLSIPEGGGVTLDFLDGHRGVQTARVALLDEADAITNLVATDASGAVLSTLINRKATIYGGYRSLDESDYAPIFTGRITGLSMLDDLTGYALELSDMSYLLDGEVCANATDSAPTILEGNPCNIYWSLLSGTFSTTHSDFPLLRVSGQVTAPETNATYSTDSAWTNASNAYDGDAATVAYGTSSASTAASVVFGCSSSAAQSFFVRVNGYVEAGSTMSLYYSTDGGTNYTLFATATETSATDYDSPMLHLDDTKQVKVRATVAAGSGTPTGWITEVYLRGSAPTGLGLAEADINTTQIANERDRWHPDDVVRVQFDAPENGQAHLREELFRVFQCWPAISQAGTLGIRFHVPALPYSAATTLTEADLAGMPSWTRLFDSHLNRFIYRGDYASSGSDYAVLYDTETADDTADQSATAETITFDVSSRWLRSDVANDYGESGVDIATDLADRVRIRYRKTPAEIEVPLHFTRRALEEGDVVALTHAQLPNLLTGTRGITAHHMTVMAVRPDYGRGVLMVTLLDTGLRRYGGIAPAAQGAYTTATAQEQDEYAWISTADAMSDGDPGYRVV